MFGVEGGGTFVPTGTGIPANRINSLKKRGECIVMKRVSERLLLIFAMRSAPANETSLTFSKKKALGISEYLELAL